ncbi:MAG: hypothetical protein HY551_06465, partial [Elusimicrobia bacterium]|nr:hypothetical protein [Elusimicrobiota bacterium]
MRGLRPGVLSLLFLPLLLSLFRLPAHAATTVRESTSKAIEAKIALESSLERRLRSLLTEVLGSEDVLVIINADLRTEQEEKEAAEEVMPGVPAKENPAIPGALGASLTMVKRIQASIIVDKSTDESDIQLIRKVTGGLLGIAPNKQDSVTIEKMAFRKVKPLSAADFLTPQQLWKIPWLLTILAALVLLYAGFLRPFLGVGRQLAEILRSQAQNGQTPASKAEAPAVAAAASNLAAAHTNGAPKGIADEERPFSFIREEHLPKLAYLMRRGTPEHLAMVIHYLPPHIASRFLESQSDGVRTRVAHYLADVTELEEAAVREVEKWIKTRIDFLVGG